MPKLVALYSPVPQSGKSSVAARLYTQGFSLIHFAGPIKWMVGALLDYADLDSRRMETTKEKPIQEFAGQPSIRKLLQTIGTEWGRGLISPELWVSLAAEKTKKVLARNCSVVIDDMRFQNEFDWVRSMGGITVRLVRAVKKGEQVVHASEGGLENQTFDLNWVVPEGLEYLDRLAGSILALPQEATNGK